MVPLPFDIRTVSHPRQKTSMASPKFMGLTGKPLSMAVTTVATTGFLLFGYDQGYVSLLCSRRRYCSHTVPVS
jgi:hypothetical protein